MKYIIIIAFILFFMVLGSELTMAQPGLPNPPSQTPIDGGLGLLAAAGGAYAMKKLRDRKRVGNDNL